jgi:hypothetical protein
MTAPSIEFTNRDMVRAVEQVVRTPRFLTQMLVKERSVHGTPYINLDKVSKNYRMIARYTSRQGEANRIGRSGFSSTIHVAPYVYEKYVMTPSDVDDRMPGQTEWEVNPSSNETEIMAEALTNLNTRLDVLEEKQVSEAIQTGKLAISGDSVDYEIDYNMNANHIITLSGGAEWDEPTTNNILGNLVTWTSLQTTKGMPAPRDLVCDNLAMGLLLDDSDIQDLLDNRNFDIGAIGFDINEDMDAVYCGRIRYRNADVRLWEYDGLYDYIDGSGDRQSGKLVADNTALLISRAQDFRFHYGKIENFKAAGFRGERFFNYIESEDGKRREVAAESSPMAGFHQPDGIVAVTVV